MKLLVIIKCAIWLRNEKSPSLIESAILWYTGGFQSFYVFGVFDLATMVAREEPQHNNINKTLGEKQNENDILKKIKYSLK